MLQSHYADHTLHHPVFQTVTKGTGVKEYKKIDGRVYRLARGMSIKLSADHQEGVRSALDMVNTVANTASNLASVGNVVGGVIAHAKIASKRERESEGGEKEPDQETDRQTGGQTDEVSESDKVSESRQRRASL